MRTKLLESDLKKQIRDYLDLKHIFNYPLLQGIGSFKGLPDRVMHYHGEVIYLEIKLPKGVLSAHQIAFQQQCAQDGIRYYVIRSLEELEAIIGGY